MFLNCDRPSARRLLYTPGMKRPVLCVYDYGQGGIWLLIDAESSIQIQRKFQMLKAYDDRPMWMSDAQKAEFVSRCEDKGFHWDIDNEPTGWLKNLVNNDGRL